MCGRCVRITPIKVSPHEKKLKEGWWSIMYLGIAITKNDLFPPRCRLTTEHATLMYVQTRTFISLWGLPGSQYPASPIHPNKLPQPHLSPQRPLNVYLPHIHAEVWKVLEGPFFCPSKVASPGKSGLYLRNGGVSRISLAASGNQVFFAAFIFKLIGKTPFLQNFARVLFWLWLNYSLVQWLHRWFRLRRFLSLLLCKSAVHTDRKGNIKLKQQGRAHGMKGSHRGSHASKRRSLWSGRLTSIGYFHIPDEEPCDCTAWWVCGRRGEQRAIERHHQMHEII